MRISIARLIALAGLLVLLPLIIVACGGDSGDGSATAPQTEQSGTGTGAGDSSAEPFRIGVMESLTGPGETYGNVALQAKQLAIDEINAAGGINGRMLELIAEDSKVFGAGCHHRL